MRISLLAGVACGWLLGAGAVEAQDFGKITDYPVVSKVWLGSIAGEVSVDPAIPMELSALGELQWKVEDGAMVEEGQVIATTDAKKIELSARSLELKRNGLRNAILDSQMSNDDKRRTLETNIQEMETKLAGMKLTSTEHQLLGNDFAKRLAVERAKVVAEIKRQREKLDGDYFETNEIHGRKNLELEVEKAENDHAALVKAAEVLAEYPGKVEILFNGEIRKTTIIGNLIKVGQAEVKVELADPRIRNVAGKELMVDISGDDGRLYQGIFSDELRERSVNRNARICIFRLQPVEPGEPLPPSLSGMRMVRVYRVLAKPGHVIEKDKFLFEYSKEISQDGWAAFVEKHWSGVKVSYVAPKVVVVNPQHEN
ncbi:MAG: hypothetical protein QM627_02060 [Luteolibacter sp.]